MKCTVGRILKLDGIIALRGIAEIRSIEVNYMGLMLHDFRSLF